MSTGELAEELVAVYADVDRRAAALEARHRGRLRCRRGCSACCVDEIAVFEVEADRIRQRHARLLAEGQPHPEGACAFLDAEGGCRIYPDRPYVCRTQGLPLSWIEEAADGTPVELRDICELNAAGPPLETLEPDACWRIGPIEGRLAALQAKRDSGALRRIRLRDLFERGVGGPTRSSTRRRDRGSDP